MNGKKITVLVILAIMLGVLYWLFGKPSTGNPEIPTSAEAIARGEYLVNAGGCAACHHSEDTDGLSGGGWRGETTSPIGGGTIAFYAPNITPDEETGIGGWTGRDFILALKHGRSPSGRFYWPAFPFRSYAGLTDEDVLDMAAYLMAQPAVRHEAPEHELPAWQIRPMMAGWNKMADWTEGAYPEVSSDDPQVRRGEYLARSLGHCGECHTPRNGMGVMLKSREFQGSDIVSAVITPEDLREEYTIDDFAYFLDSGMMANFDFVGGEMLEVIDHTSQLTQEDLEAYAAFMLRQD